MNRHSSSAKPPRRPRPTLRDVADSVGVHLSTVSRVLNNKRGYVVSEEVAAKIRKAASDLGYQTNPFAYSLRVNRSFTIGVLIPDLTNPVFPPIIRGIEHYLARSEYTAILADCDNNQDEERRILERMKARQTDGLILATAQRDDDLIRTCVDEGHKVVLVNRSVEDRTVSSVTNDDVEGISQAVTHLVELGHRRIAHVAGPQAIPTGYARYRAYRSALHEHGLTPENDLIAFCETFSEEDGRRALMSLLDRKGDFTAVVAANDLIALGCYGALEATGLRCPENVSVTGYNDMPFVDKFQPPLTTVRIPLYEMGRKAAQEMLDLLESPSSQPKRLKLQPSLIVRGSTAPPPPRSSLRRGDNATSRHRPRRPQRGQPRQ